MSNLFKIPTNWDELVKLKDFLSDCDVSYLRLPNDKNFYVLYRELVPKEIALEIIKRQMNNKSAALVQNNFPYSNILQHLPKVRHYCLWSLNKKLAESKIKKLVKKDFPDNKWFYSERKVGHKSVPEIWHCHVFVNLD